MKNVYYMYSLCCYSHLPTQHTLTVNSSNREKPMLQQISLAFEFSVASRNLRNVRTRAKIRLLNMADKDEESFESRGYDDWDGDSANSPYGDFGHSPVYTPLYQGYYPAYGGNPSYGLAGFRPQRLCDTMYSARFYAPTQFHHRLPTSMVIKYSMLYIGSLKGETPNFSNITYICVYVCVRLELRPKRDCLCMVLDIYCTCMYHVSYIQSQINEGGVGLETHHVIYMFMHVCGFAFDLRRVSTGGE